jgi:putative radical SAM enzyme (TIGR03279 family)
MTAVISRVREGSVAEEKGLKKGDILLSINKYPVNDVIDYLHYSKEDTLNLQISRGNRTHTVVIKRKGNADPGIEFRSFRIRKCRNRCVFCFIDQLPKGMRKSLYIKDDDYRMSFLYGNYITLTNLTTADRRRIAEQRLSPLYVSIHSTNNDTRRKMLGNPRAGDIIAELKELTSHRIRIHAQIVVCPGINDGEELLKSLKDLQRFYPYLQSIALVPVGLTRHRKFNIKPVSKDDALRVIEIARDVRKRFKKRHGDPLVHVADEFYIKADMPFPSYTEYGDFPQIENGVGLVTSFLASAKKMKLPKRLKDTRVAVFTGVSFMPYLEDFISRLRTIAGLSIDLIQVKNEFFGSSVTVTGLLTGKDIFKAVVGKTKADCLLVPDITLKHDEDIFLDNVTIKDMEEGLGMRVIPIKSTPEGLLRGITNGY